MGQRLYWRITKDKVAEPGEPKRVGVEGPAGCDSSLATPVKFRLYDDDDELYYEGVAADDDSAGLPTSSAWPMPVARASTFGNQAGNDGK